MRKIEGEFHFSGNKGIPLIPALCWKSSKRRDICALFMLCIQVQTVKIGHLLVKYTVHI
jgi:hypothetical protein